MLAFQDLAVRITERKTSVGIVLCCSWGVTIYHDDQGDHARYREMTIYDERPARHRIAEQYGRWMRRRGYVNMVRAPSNVRDEIGSMACVFTTGSLHAVNLEELELCPATPTPC